MSELSTPLETTPEPDAHLNKKRKGGTQTGSKVSAEILARRKEGRIKAMATMQSQIEKSGIKRMETTNKLASSIIIPVPLINQKNYYTDYLKKDDQMMMLRDIKDFNLKLKESKQQKMLEKLKLNNSSMTPEVTAVTLKDDDNDEDEDDEDEDIEFTKVGSDTIVIHPGSNHIRIGLATDVYPKSVPNVILYPLLKGLTKPPTEIFPERDLDSDEITIENDDFMLAKKTVTANFKERMRYYKRRILPSSNEQCYNFNKRIQLEKIPEHNDIHKFEFINSEQLLKDHKYLVGEDALRLDNYDDWLLRSPLKNGGFNEQDYSTAQEVLGDLELIISSVLEKEFQINSKISNNYKVVLIIPNLYDKSYIDHFMNLLLKNLNFGKVAIMQEGIAGTFGSGISSGCVVDIGAQATRISCIDEGMILENSQIDLDYGGDDITRLFITLLLQNQFPYREINLNDVNDLRLATELKEKYVTFQDADVAIQVYNFMVRKANQLTEKYEFKVFDEVMISAMGLFYPQLFTALRPNTVEVPHKMIPFHVDYFSGESDNCGSYAQENTLNGTPLTTRLDRDVLQYLSDLAGAPQPFKTSDKPNFTPLDVLIIESISQCSSLDLGKMKKLYENILLVGGGSKISGFDNILYDRINIMRSRLLSCSNLEDIFKLIELERSLFFKDHEKEELYRISDDLMIKIEDLIASSSILPVEILSSSREIEPEILCWKGGSVYGRIKVVNEMMVDYKEYDLLGLRCFQHKSMFNF